jgi:hypothetical protein
MQRCSFNALVLSYLRSDWQHFQILIKPGILGTKMSKYGMYGEHDCKNRSEYKRTIKP